ncbi:MAG: tRNA preQ1(34) S-adenosylmethionine ribosyltransferase-isomerase QueA [Pseudomonadota bacterium]
MPTSDSPLDRLQFDLPKSHIATLPAPEREKARLFVYDRGRDATAHAAVSDISKWLRRGDVLVLNDTRVDPVRVVWRKRGGGRAELLLLKLLKDPGDRSEWEALVAGKRIRIGSSWDLPENLRLTLLERNEGTLCRIELSAGAAAVRAWLEKVGSPPLPPYIRAARKSAGMDDEQEPDSERYQTEFARNPGAVAAPTAGLHFSKALLERLRGEGVETVFLTLDVGWGTFQPLSSKEWVSGRLHPEYVKIPSETAKRILAAKEAGRRIVAVGTTVVRSLEWWNRSGAPAGGVSGWCDLFLRPPWTPAVVDALVTNFHLPGSSLLALVAGFLGKDGIEKIKNLYAEAIRREYRFYSYGDAMLIL